MENNKRIIIQFFEEVWNKRKLEIADEIFDRNCHSFQLHSGVPAESTPRGPQAIKEHIGEWLSGFPDLIFTIQQMIAEGDLVSTLLAMDGTHTGPWQGIPPSGKRINIRMATIHRIRNGKIIEDWVIVESLGFLQQVGVVAGISDLLNGFRRGKE